MTSRYAPWFLFFLIPVLGSAVEKPCQIYESQISHLDDRDFVFYQLNTAPRMGSMASLRDSKFDTTVYYTATAKPRPDGSIPVVDPDARAVYIFLHGSGTARAGGINAAGKATHLASMGYSVISLDLPFHQEGSTNPELLKAPQFIDYLARFFADYSLPGKNNYGSGHSFGPDALAALLDAHPFSMKGAALLSPACFDNVTRDWYEKHTVNMPHMIGGPENENEAGGEWADSVSQGFNWSDLGHPLRRDPTVLNPDLRLIVASGGREEYLPGGLNPDGTPDASLRTYDLCKKFAQFYSRIDCRIFQGVGHYIFEGKDDNGYDLVLETLLALDGQSLANERALKQEFRQRNQSVVDQVARRYKIDPFFKEWLNYFARKSNKQSGLEIIVDLIKTNNQGEAARLNKRYSFVESNRNKELVAHILSTRNWAPAFYRENQATIDGFEGQKAPNLDLILSKYLAFLQTLDPVTRALHTRTTEETIYTIPDLPTGPPPGWVPREKKQK
jgi:pimeloyl-ACP methyl ester carboxylesterase